MGRHELIDEDRDRDRDRDRERRAERRRRRERRRKRGRARNQRHADKAAFTAINWDFYSHKQLYKMIMSAQPAGMRQRADDWLRLAVAIADTTDKMQVTVRKLGVTWRGSAADHAQTRKDTVAQWTSAASDIATRIGTGLHRYTEAVEFAQRRIPPPPSRTGIAFLAGSTGGGATVPNSAVLVGELLQDGKADHDAARDAKAEAVLVMTAYGRESQVVHDEMPAFDAPPPAPPPPVDPAPPGEPVGPPPFDRPRDGGNLPRPDPDGAAAWNATTTAQAQVPGNPGPIPGGGPGERYGGGSGHPGAVPGPGGGADPTRGPGFGSGGGFAGAAPLGGRGPAGGMPGGVGAGGGLAGARGAGGPGAGGLFPPPAGAAGAPHEQDGEHKNKYADRLDLFDDMLPAFPPVLGA